MNNIFLEIAALFVFINLGSFQKNFLKYALMFQIIYSNIFIGSDSGKWTMMVSITDASCHIAIVITQSGC